MTDKSLVEMVKELNKRPVSDKPPVVSDRGCHFCSCYPVVDKYEGLKLCTKCMFKYGYGKE